MILAFESIVNFVAQALSILLGLKIKIGDDPAVYVEVYWFLVMLFLLNLFIATMQAYFKDDHSKWKQ